MSDNQVACPECNGSGYLWGVKGKKECSCKLKARALEYLTPMYADARYYKELDTSKLLNKNIYCKTNDKHAFKTAVKSFLLNTGMKFKHLTVTPYDLLQLYLRDAEDKGFSRLFGIDYIFIMFIADPKNGHYGNIISSLLESRDLRGTKTWIFSEKNLESDAFIKAYSQELSDIFKRTYVVFNLSPKASTPISSHQL
ncbi:MAG: hypothetical protein HQK56_20285 [Deltaproteobacteria bacterium]|nr:hypothetical protein [Deltaproteobacteria bacterium]